MKTKIEFYIIDFKYKISTNEATFHGENRIAFPSAVIPENFSEDGFQKKSLRNPEQQSTRAAASNFY